MRLDKIKTLEDFDYIAGIWHKRASTLLDIFCNDKSRPLKQHFQAYKLWLTMFNRVLNMQEIYSNMVAKSTSNIKFKPGGICSDKEDVILPRESYFKDE